MGKKSNKKKDEGEEESSASRVEDKKQEVDPDTEVESGSTSISKDDDNGKPEYGPSSAPKHKKTKGKKDNQAKPKPSRMLILFRNAEQMDKIFPEWIHKNFVDGKYVPTDMNQPIKLPLRKTPLVAYDQDPPLTEMGMRVAQLIGKTLAESGIHITSVFASPALRCIQTAQYLIKAQLYDLKICVEPAFYDFAGLRGKEIPIFLSTSELIENQFPIDKAYKPITPLANLSKFAKETPHEFFTRQSNNIYNLTKRSATGTILIVTHACTIHAAGRGLIGKTQHSMKKADMLRVPFNYPYCSAIAFKPAPDGRWAIATETLPPLNFSHFSNRFNHSFFVKNG